MNIIKCINKLKRTGLWLLIISIGFTLGCEKQIDLDVNDPKIQVFIEGYITNRLENDTIKIHKTKAYFSDNNFEGVSGALVVVYDDEGNRDTLSEAYPGAYTIDSTKIKAKPRHTYYLTVVVEGDTFTSQCFVPDFVPLTTLTYRYRTDNITLFTPEGYYVSIWGQDPDTLGNNYRLVVSKNDTIFQQAQDFNFSEDRPFNGIFFTLELPYDFEENDTISAELWSIDPVMLDFYNTLIKQLISGSPFAPPGDNIKGNINGALGFFGAYMVSKETIIIKK